MLQISYAGCLGLSPAIWAQFILEMRVAARNHEKFTKTPYSVDSKSFKVIDVDIPVLVMISSMFVPIFNQFHIRRANNGKITLF